VVGLTEADVVKHWDFAFLAKRTEYIPKSHIMIKLPLKNGIALQLSTNNNTFTLLVQLYI